MLSRTRILFIMTEWLPEVAKAIKEQIMENLTALPRGGMSCIFKSLQ